MNIVPAKLHNHSTIQITAHERTNPTRKRSNFMSHRFRLTSHVIRRIFHPLVETCLIFVIITYIFARSVIMQAASKTQNRKATHQVISYWTSSGIASLLKRDHICYNPRFSIRDKEIIQLMFKQPARSIHMEWLEKTFIDRSFHLAYINVWLHTSIQLHRY